MKVKETSLTTVCAVLAVFGAGALQIAVALSTIPDLGVRVAFCIAIGAAIIMDALVIHAIGNAPTNKVQKGIALGMLTTLFLGLALDVVLLLTHEAFDNQQFGWLRAFVGINIALSLVLAAAFFAFSDTNTHERQVKALQHNAEMNQSRAFYGSQEAADLFATKVRAEIVQKTAEELGVPVSQLQNYLGMSSVVPGAATGQTLPARVSHPGVESEPSKNGNFH